MKKQIIVEMKIKEYNGEYWHVVEKIELQPEQAIMLLSKKYCSNSKKKNFLQRLDQVFPEIDKELNKIFSQ